MKPAEPKEQQSQLIEITMLLVALAGLGVIVALAVALAFSSTPTAMGDTRGLGTTERAYSTPVDPADLASS